MWKRLKTGNNMEQETIAKSVTCPQCHREYTDRVNCEVIEDWDQCLMDDKLNGQKND